MVLRQACRYAAQIPFSGGGFPLPKVYQSHAWKGFGEFLTDLLMMLGDDTREPSDASATTCVLAHLETLLRSELRSVPRQRLD